MFAPPGALQVIKRDSAAYDPEATHIHVQQKLGCGCPGSMAREIQPTNSLSPQSGERVGVRGELNQWPIQLHLVSPQAPYFNEADLLIAADCTAFTLGSFHQDLLKGKKLVIACPKLDDTSTYIDKIADILRNNIVYSLTVAIMTVPCCSGLLRIVEEAIRASGKPIAIKKVIINLDGSIKK